MEKIRSSSDRNSISIGGAILIFLIMLSIFFGSIAYVVVTYVVPFTNKVRDARLSREVINNTTENPSATDSPEMAKRREYNLAMTAAKKQYQEDQYSEATASASTAIESAQTNTEIINSTYLRGRSYYELKKYKNAEADLKAVLALNEEYIPAYELLLSIYFDRKDYASAVIYGEKAIIINPNSSLLHNQLGVAYDGQNRIKEALAQYKKAVELDPNNKVAAENARQEQEYLDSLNNK